MIEEQAAAFAVREMSPWVRFEPPEHLFEVAPFAGKQPVVAKPEPRASEMPGAVRLANPLSRTKRPARRTVPQHAVDQVGIIKAGRRHRIAPGM